MTELPLLCTQAQYDEWWEAKCARAADPDDRYHEADVNDCLTVYATARTIFARYPAYRMALVDHAPRIVERAGEDLGLFMGVAALAKLIGMDPDEATAITVELITAAR